METGALKIAVGVLFLMCCAVQITSDLIKEQPASVWMWPINAAIWCAIATWIY